MADTNQILRLAAIIREVDGNHSKGAAALAESILDHPGFRVILAKADEPAVPECREPAAVTGQLSDEELLKLAQQWLTEGHHQDYCSATNHAIAQAARWGDEQRLEACIAWLRYNYPSVNCEALRSTMHSKPPSNLKEQALMQLQAMEQAGALDCNIDAIRRALERLQELEEGNE